MKRSLIVMLLLAGCSDTDPMPDNSSGPVKTLSAPVSGTPAAEIASRGMSGSVSDLKGDITGLNVRTSDTRIIVDLPADTLFAFDSAELTDESAANLGKVADLIRQASAGTIEVTGHTDAKGDDSYNLALSQRRAQSVADWMSDQVGVRQRVFTVVGKGEAEPVAANETLNGKDDPTGRAKNRRVVVSIPR